MNIFFLNKDPHKCAVDHLDKHSVKMPTEYGQLLSTAHRMLDGTMYLDKTANNRNIKRWRHPDEEMEAVLYKASHCGHPSAVWCRETNENYEWLYELFIEINREYTYRYGKIHGAGKVLAEALKNPPKNIPIGAFTEPPPAMKHYPQCIVPNDSIASYKNYYREAKASFATWKNRPIPKWFHEVSHG